MTATNTAAPYTLISSDCHAGGNMKAYEEYLAPAYREAVSYTHLTLPTILLV